MSKTLKERIMDPLTIGLLCFLGGSLLTGGTIWGIQEAEKNKVKETTELVTAIGQLKDQIRRRSKASDDKLD